ncbi:DUF1501 domain-containing protein [Mesorhizobium qingshengii]|uniref:DUF1501 domain-containing protein n=2 Tax=Mesorhizobium qingshengii TaxID=1165689 RepID=A0ABT4R2J3_9HYPH|nr:DUF1501 domain-containing protein [Mesorhizobium qingshengii]MCZ8547966.1 DUF1501 domain-containing protein [Mesorhizobium qingshengii]
MVVVILRGALDGLAVVPPIGDPNYARLRGELAIGVAGIGRILSLDGFFSLHDAMRTLHAHYVAGDTLIVHAVATPYRDRSHFDGQDVLESGMPGPRDTVSGWLNRAVLELPVGDQIEVARPVGLAISPTVPLIFRGAAPTLTWTPPNFQSASPDTQSRLLELYGEIDPALLRAFVEGREIDSLSGHGDVPVPRTKTAGPSFREAAEGAAKLLAAESGPRIAALVFDGWDTHANEGAEHGKLARLLAALDDALDGLASGLKSVWHDTVIVVITEFGRTARINGNEGTDHGTATTAFLMGGAVKGGRVVADWPGLGNSQLHQGRDLMPTTDLRAVLKGLLRDHLGVSEFALSQRVFPSSIAVRPLNGLIG